MEVSTSVYCEGNCQDREEAQHRELGSFAIQHRRANDIVSEGIKSSKVLGVNIQ